MTEQRGQMPGICWVPRRRRISTVDFWDHGCEAASRRQVLPLGISGKFVDNLQRCVWTCDQRTEVFSESMGPRSSLLSLSSAAPLALGVGTGGLGQSDSPHRWRWRGRDPRTSCGRASRWHMESRRGLADCAFPSGRSGGIDASHEVEWLALCPLALRDLLDLLLRHRLQAGQQVLHVPLRRVIGQDEFLRLAPHDVGHPVGPSPGCRARRSRDR
jgi:hypothetical protein